MIDCQHNIFGIRKEYALWDREKAWQQFKEMNDEAIERQRAVVEAKGQTQPLNENYIQREAEKQLKEREDCL